MRASIPAVTLLALLGVVAPAAAQVQNRPTDAPVVSAVNERWYQLREPVPFAGDWYYPAGATVFFNGNAMVRTGHYNGVPLYADTTLEPYSIVFVPIGRGLMQPYERLRHGELAGTTGSRPPSFPVRAVPDAAGVPAAATAPTMAPLPIGAIDVFTPAPAPSAVRVVSVPTAGAASPAGGAERQDRRDGSPVATLLAPESNDGVWITFGGGKWVSAGPAVPLRAADFLKVGDYAGFPVFAREGGKDNIIYLPTRAGLVAPYRLRR